MLLAARGTGNWVAFLVVVPFSKRYPRLAVATGLTAQAVAAWAMAQLDINLGSFDVFWTICCKGSLRACLHADDGLGLRHPAGPPDHRRLRGLHPGAQFRRQPLHLGDRGAAGAFDRGELFADERVHNALQQGAVVPGMPSAWDIGSSSGLMRLADEIQRQAAMIGYINAFYLLAFTAAVGMPLVWLMRAAPRTR